MKTKALISCAVTGQLICAFCFAYTKSRFSHDAARKLCHIFSLLSLSSALVFLGRKQVVLAGPKGHDISLSLEKVVFLLSACYSNLQGRASRTG